MNITDWMRIFGGAGPWVAVLGGLFAASFYFCRFPPGADDFDLVAEIGLPSAGRRPADGYARFPGSRYRPRRQRGLRFSRNDLIPSRASGSWLVAAMTSTA